MLPAPALQQRLSHSERRLQLHVGDPSSELSQCPWLPFSSCMANLGLGGRQCSTPCLAPSSSAQVKRFVFHLDAAPGPSFGKSAQQLKDRRNRASSRLLQQASRSLFSSTSCLRRKMCHRTRLLTQFQEPLRKLLRQLNQLPLNLPFSLPSPAGP